MGILRKKIFDFFPSSFGLDLSDLSIKAVWLDRSGTHDSVASFGSVPLAIGNVVDGEIMNPEAVKNAVESILEKAGPKKIKTRQVICSLPITCFSKNTFPFLTLSWPSNIFDSLHRTGSSRVEASLSTRLLPVRSSTMLPA